MIELASPARRERNTVLAALELFRATGASRVFYTMLLFLYVCENEGLTVSELAYVARMHVTTTARLVKAMAGEPGLEVADPDGEGEGLEAPLLEVRSSADDHRLKFIHLSAAGRALRSRVGALIASAVQIEG